MGILTLPWKRIQFLAPSFQDRQCYSSVGSSLYHEVRIGVKTPKFNNFASFFSFCTASILGHTCPVLYEL